MPSTSVTVSENAARTDPRAGKYLTFALGKEEFAIPVLRVREIMGVQEITRVPQTPAHVKGVINLRGKVIPVVDLRLKFGMAEREYTARTCIIVVQTEQDGAKMLTGVVVDEVSEVLNMQAGDIEDTPEFGRGVATPYLVGMAKIKGKVKILLDINLVMSAQDLHGLTRCTDDAIA
ncbi:MAG TPA: chemotaxis protein CheW [Bryobacteraceae bacterium]|jgi:purine-binding chemotaxis protein CheW|nr:chemotaxis protein CheW [Bryobacteraceae bacterium]